MMPKPRQPMNPVPVTVSTGSQQNQTHKALEQGQSRQVGRLQQLRNWRGWPGVAVAAGLCVVAGGMLLAGHANTQANRDDIAFYHDFPEPNRRPTIRSAPEQRAALLHALSPTALFDSIAVIETQGKKYLRVRAVAGGPEITIDAITGHVVDTMMVESKTKWQETPESTSDEIMTNDTVESETPPKAPPIIETPPVSLTVPMHQRELIR
jgi:hypothetical protein